MEEPVAPGGRLSPRSVTYAGVPVTVPSLGTTLNRSVPVKLASGVYRTRETVRVTISSVLTAPFEGSRETWNDTASPSASVAWRRTGTSMPGLTYRVRASAAGARLLDGTGVSASVLASANACTGLLIEERPEPDTVTVYLPLPAALNTANSAVWLADAALTVCEPGPDTAKSRFATGTVWPARALEGCSSIPPCGWAIQTRTIFTCFGAPLTANVYCLLAVSAPAAGCRWSCTTCCLCSFAYFSDSETSSTPRPALLSSARDAMPALPPAVRLSGWFRCEQPDVVLVDVSYWEDVHGTGPRQSAPRSRAAFTAAGASSGLACSIRAAAALTCGAA